MKNDFYRGKLPHFQPQGGTFFVTYHLAGSIPKVILQKLREEYDREITHLEQQPIQDAIREKRYEAQKRHFKRFDDYLDALENGPHWLRIPAIAKLHTEALHYYDGVCYTLWAYCIMSNHVHLLLSLKENAPILWRVLQNIKKYSGKEGNKILGRKNERFWENESYDHLVREKDEEFNRILGYILNNPVKAGLVDDWREYRWSYCHPDFL